MGLAVRLPRISTGRNVVPGGGRDVLRGHGEAQLQAAPAAGLLRVLRERGKRAAGPRWQLQHVRPQQPVRTGQLRRDVSVSDKSVRCDVTMRQVQDFPGQCQHKGGWGVADLLIGIIFVKNPPTPRSFKLYKISERGENSYMYTNFQKILHIPRSEICYYFPGSTAAGGSLPA